MEVRVLTPAGKVVESKRPTRADRDENGVINPPAMVGVVYFFAGMAKLHSVSSRPAPLAVGLLYVQ